MIYGKMPKIFSQPEDIFKLTSICNQTKHLIFSGVTNAASI